MLIRAVIDKDRVVQGDSWGEILTTSRLVTLTAYGTSADIKQLAPKHIIKLLASEYRTYFYLRTHTNSHHLYAIDSDPYHITYNSHALLLSKHLHNHLNCSIQIENLTLPTQDIICIC